MSLRRWVAAGAAVAVWGGVALTGLPAAAQTSASAVSAPNARSEALVRRYLAAIKFEALMDTTMRSIIPVLTDSMGKQYPSISAEDRKEIGEVVADVMRQKTMPEMINQTVPIYAEVFSESELEAMVAFYESPAGRAITDKAPLLAPKTAEIMRGLMPDMQRDVVARLCAKFGCDATKPAAKPRAS